MQADRDRMLERYRAMTEEASDIIILMEDGQVVCASAALGRLLGRKPEEFQDGRYLDTVHPDDLDEARKVQGRPGPGDVWTATYRVRHADGHYIWFEITTRGVYDETTGAFLREISVGRDITERKEHELKMRAAQDRAEAANKAKTLFLANMSHELRTPLNAIIGFSDIMQRQLFGGLGNKRYEDYAAQISEAGNRLLGVICDILDVARLDAGTVELALEPLDFAEIIEDCLRGLREGAEARGIALAAEVPAVSLNADRRAFKQIVLNLLSNAVKFTVSGGHVSVDVREGSGRIALIVGDDGVGIPASDLLRLGRPFEQVCADPRLAKNGAGLGLALVRALAEKHGGGMSIASEQGVGTTVTVEFPPERARAVA